MIGRVASACLGSLWGRYILAGLAVLAGVAAYGEIKRLEGGRAESARREVDTIKTIRRVQRAGSRVPTDRRSTVDRLRSGKF